MNDGNGDDNGVNGDDDIDVNDDSIDDYYLAHVGSRESVVRVEDVKRPVLLEGVVVRCGEDVYDDDGDDDEEEDDDDDYDDDYEEEDDDDDDYDDDDDHLSREGPDCP